MRSSRQHNRVQGQCDFYRDVYPYMFFQHGPLHHKQFYLIKLETSKGIFRWLDPRYDTVVWNVADPNKLVQVCQDNVADF